MKWHLQDIQEVAKAVGTSARGLTNEEIDGRLDEYGYNELESKKKISFMVFLLRQFRDFMILILLVTAGVAMVFGDLLDAVIILIIVVLNALLGAIQEYRAEKALEALNRLSAPNAKVIRNGRDEEIPSKELVPGDIVLLEAGDMIPADLRLMEVKSLRVEESSLTGESVPVDKTTDVLKDESIPLGEQFNMAFKSTLVTNGRGKGIVVATGMKTEIGKIAGMLHGEESDTPLKQRMTDLGKKLTWMVMTICAILFLVGWLRGEEPIQMLMVSISLAVAAIPEALPALITVSLARGAAKMVRKNALIRKLPAVETLGSVSYICTDKTGTLTQNKMTVTELVPAEEAMQVTDAMSLLEWAMAISNDVKPLKDGELSGDPTEVALVAYIAREHGEGTAKQLREQYKREAEIPFDSDRKAMTTIHALDDGFMVITKGAIEVITGKLKNGDGAAFSARAEELAKEGMRVLAFAYRKMEQVPDELNAEEIERDLEFAGMVGMIDPPKEEVKEAIHDCRTAGITTVMITGDHLATAEAIARDIGILADGDLTKSGADLEKYSDEEFERDVEHIKVYARVSPQQKLDIVKALQHRGHFVAMTGDGVNDAPSLRMANIGVAMGQKGTDVSKEAAHMVLLDDNFATIVKAVKEGRRIYDNIRKFVKYIMTCNSAEILIIFLAPLLGMPMPLLPIHILWINLVTDGVPALMLSAERAEPDIMNQPPRGKKESIFAKGVGYHIVWVGAFMAILILATQYFSIKAEKEHWQTMVFFGLSIIQLGHVLAIRSHSESVYKRGFLSNIPLLLAVVATLILQLLIVYLPFANKIFHTQPLTVNELLICAGLAVVLFHAVELEKWIKARKHKKS